jgi:hypothetical protein
MKIIKHIPLSLLTITLLASTTLIALENTDDTLIESKDWVILPYAFAGESTGTVGGIGVIKQGLLQPQTTFVATLFGGLSEDIIVQGQEEEASFSGGFFSFSDYKLPFTNRLYFSAMGAKRFYPKARYYFDGSNNSSDKNVFITSGDSDFLNATLKYVLPIGEGVDNPDNVYTLREGFAVDREDKGNGVPFVTGKTYVGIKGFYQHSSFDNSPLPNIQGWDSNGLRFFLTHDNTDFDLNPSRGYHFEVQYSEDYGQGDSSQSWDFVEFKYNKYISLDTFSFTKQNVLAMSFWTGYSDSWDNNSEIYPGINAHRPSTGEGATLGGMFKMRGYDSNRFSDKAAIYATAEYRAVLNYNPIRNNSVLPVAVDWFQVVAFAEVGRVHDSYDFDLLTDVKYDVGLSLRALVAQLPIRFDVAYSEEGTNLWLMLNQPFDF